MDQSNSPPTLLVHGLCIRVRRGESNRVLRVKRHPPASGHGEDNAERHQVIHRVVWEAHLFNSRHVPRFVVFVTEVLRNPRIDSADSVGVSGRCYEAC